MKTNQIIFIFQKGDSGGPLYFLDIINFQSKYVVAGITSYGKDCALIGYPG